MTVNTKFKNRFPLEASYVSLNQPAVVHRLYNIIWSRWGQWLLFNQGLNPMANRILSEPRFSFFFIFFSEKEKEGKEYRKKRTISSNCLTCENMADYIVHDISHKHIVARTHQAKNILSSKKTNSANPAWSSCIISPFRRCEKYKTTPVLVKIKRLYTWSYSARIITLAKRCSYTAG